MSASIQGGGGEAGAWDNSEHPLRAALVDGLSVLRLDLTGTQIEALLAYLDLLLKWNRVYNLTAIRSSQQALTHHLLDSLAAVPMLAAAAREVGGTVLDVGSGGGLPGIPLAITHPELSVTLVDAVRKKTAFQVQVKAELRLRNLHPRAARVEQLAPPMVPDGGFAVITSRAFADLADFVRLAGGLLAPGGGMLAMKGGLPQKEIERLPQGWRVARVMPLVVPGLDAQRHLLMLERQR